MDPSLVPLAGGEIHGFRTLADLDVAKLMDDASTRWFRPNELYAILTNYTHFNVHPQPVEHPSNGCVLLFDRKMLRNFRKDGYNWKKKKDGKTVQEAHEKLKVGNEERIHVYYARGEDDPNFYRRCYWLLDKNLERIVLVHYRQTLEENATLNISAPFEFTEPSVANKMNDGSPLTSVNSTTGSSQSDWSSAVMSEEIISTEDQDIYTGSGIFLSKEHTGLQSNELSLSDINKLDWEDLALASAYVEPAMGRTDGPCDGMQYKPSKSVNDDCILTSQPSSSDPVNSVLGDDFPDTKQVRSGYLETPEQQGMQSVLLNAGTLNTRATDLKLRTRLVDEDTEILNDNVFVSQNCFGQWNNLNDVSLSSLDCFLHDGQLSSFDRSDSSMARDHSSSHQQIFSISEVSPEWAYSAEETKVLVIGAYNESHKHLKSSNIYCAFGKVCVCTQMVQPGVYRCTALPQTPGRVDLFLTLDGHTPISQVIPFDYRCAPMQQLNYEVNSKDTTEKFKPKDIMLQKRLAYLLFSTTDSISILSSKVHPKAVKDAKKFASLTSPFIEKDWNHLIKSGYDNDIACSMAGQDLFQLILKNKLQEWLVEKVVGGGKTTAHDSQGQGVIHLCTLLDYTWAIRLFSLSGISLDFRDTSGWTALHWAAYLGREKMVALLLSAGANPSLVTDPTPENRGGLTAADLASKGGFEGLAAYLAEKGLTAHFEAMSLSGNIPLSRALSSKTQVNSEDLYSEILSEQELCLKESLAAYRNAADAADRIQAAFRERTLKLQTEAVQLVKPEIEASEIVSVLKIQHAYRNHARRKLMKAAARIQSHFRTWQTRKDFLNMRRQAIKIQAVFRGHQVRKQYRKIVWSVGVLEKAILRWRLKRRGLRGIHVETMEVGLGNSTEESTSAEEDFFQISRKQAEERVQRSVVRVQAMFRSYRAQQEYRRMKTAYEEAKLEFSLNDIAGFQ